MAEGKTNMFGKTYNTIGSTESNFIIKTKGDLKVQWGNKFIDIIKNGKIASSDSKILKSVNSSEEIDGDGIYLVLGDLIWISIDGTNIDLSSQSGTMYVSFLINLEDVTPDLKRTALTNIGFYYETLDNVKLSGVTAGIVYIELEEKLYLVKNGQLSEYKFSNQEELNNKFDTLYIGDITIYTENGSGIIDSSGIKLTLNGLEYLSLSNNLVRVNQSISMLSNTKILSEGATQFNGFRLYNTPLEGSTLEVDNIICRNGFERESYENLTDQEIKSLHNNILKSLEEGDGCLVGELLYDNEFSNNLEVYLFLDFCYVIDVTYDDYSIKATILEDGIAPENIIILATYDTGDTAEVVIFKGNNSGSILLETTPTIESYRIISGPQNASIGESKDVKLLPYKLTILGIEGKIVSFIVLEEFKNYFLTSCNNSLICIADKPFIKIKNNNLDLLDRSKLIILDLGDGIYETVRDETIHTRLGVVSEKFFSESLEKCPEGQEEVDVGIYSDNFIGLNSKLYDSVFKKRCDYPKYDESIELPEDLNDDKYKQAIPNIAWIKELIKQEIPKGTITMFSGTSDIPDGWAVCDGTNGTPNLVGKFIKAVSSIDNIGENESELDENNEFILTKDHLPKHSHPHEAHSHSLSGTTENSGDLTVSFDYTNYNWDIESVPKSVITSVSGENITTENGTVNEISNIKTQGGNATGASHTHGISLNTSSTISQEDSSLSWPNKSIKIEPRSYSLIFIMKI